MRKLVLAPDSQGLRPRTGQHLSLEFYDLAVTGTVQSMRWDTMAFRPDSPAAASVLRAQSHVTSTYALAHGVISARFVVIGMEGTLLHLQLVGEPALVQRRSHPRVTVSVPARLIWHAAGNSDLVEVPARTQNLSLGGARIRFEDPPCPVSTMRSTTFLELGLPDGPASVVAKFLQVWDDGARVRIVEVEPSDQRRLADFIDAGLTRRPDLPARRPEPPAGRPEAPAHPPQPPLRRADRPARGSRGW